MGLPQWHQLCPELLSAAKGLPGDPLTLGWVSPTQRPGLQCIWALGNPLSEGRSHLGVSEPLDSQASRKRRWTLSRRGLSVSAIAGNACGPRLASNPTHKVASAQDTYLGWAEQKLVEVLQPRLDAMQDTGADGARPVQSLRAGVQQAL